jgi:hypothetical protein
LGLNEDYSSNSPNTWLNIGCNEINSDASVVRTSIVVRDRFEQLANESSAAYNYALNYGPFDVVNLDLCSSISPLRLQDLNYYGALGALAKLQVRSRAGDEPWLLLVLAEQGGLGCDKRITRIGNFLRKSRIDEIPQLWNVFMGDMSLIGPRAEWTRLVDDYERTIPCYHFRHLVRPGITGWAQVNYPYGASKEDAMRKLEYDLYYIRHFSFRLDASIILKTIHLMLFGKGR